MQTNNSMEESINDIFIKDCTLLGIFTATLWGVMIPTVIEVLKLTHSIPVQTTLLIMVILLGVSLTSGLIAVFLHIKTNKAEIYSEDIYYLKKLNEEMN